MTFRFSAPKNAASLLLLAILVGTGGMARADRTGDQIAFAASGRFDQLEKMLEADAAKGPLDTPDLHALCYAYSKTKRYDRLIDCLDKLEKNLAGKNRRTRLFGLDDATPVMHLMRAEAFVDLARYDDAIMHARRALDWYRSTNSADKDVEIQAIATIAIAASLKKDKPQALEQIATLEKVSVAWPLYSQFANAKAMALARSNLAVGNYTKVIDSLGGVSTFKVDAFLDDLVSGAAFKGYSNWLWAELPRTYMLNKARLESGRMAEARAGFDRMLGLRQVQSNGDIFWLMLFDRGRIAEADKRDEEALNFYKRAIDVIEQQRASVNTEANKIGFVGDKQAAYGNFIAVALRLGKLDVAFEYVERSKSRALVDLLAGRESIAIPPDAPLIARSQLAEYRQAVQESVAQAPVDAGQGEAGGKRNLVIAQTQLVTAVPSIASLITVNSTPVHELQAGLEEGEVFVQYFGQAESLYAFVLGKKDIRLAKLSAAGMEQDIRGFRENLQNMGADAIAISQRLYQRLIAPLALRADERKLVMIPHGMLHYVPFAALHDGSDFLLASRTLRYLPSATVTRYIRPPSAGPVGPVFLLGNPDLGDSRLDLPNAETEVRNIRGKLSDAEILIRKQATETAFKKFSSSYRYLHIASHGEFSSSGALESRLLLAKDADNDGSLTVAEIYGLKLKADLITLSACETGLGEVMNGNDVIGLTRGFLYAGASNIVASLWQVDDNATSQLMLRFYEALFRGLKKSEALRDAQNEVRKDFQHPFFWAAFFLTGNGQ